MAETDEVKNFEKKMVSGLYRFDCPEPFELGDFHFGLLPDETAKKIKEHLKECPYCREELTGLNEFLKEEPVPLQFKFKELEDIKKIIPFGQNEVHYVALERKAAVRSETVKEHKKVSITYSETENIELLYLIEEKDAFYILKGQLMMNEFLEEIFIDSLIEVWQADNLITVVKIDDLCSFHCVMKKLNPVIIRISNQSGTLLSFQLDLS